MLISDGEFRGPWEGVCFGARGEIPVAVWEPHWKAGVDVLRTGFRVGDTLLCRSV